ncbi:GNAT family N-acetyltransferase [Microbacterium xanthum]|uniref:GNAT family N-acetyltransferase n=1 Tax=Microbacterium xanthum TaxID=3079794 RepID=UPI002AD3127B|nr:MULTISPECIES: GNAT family N-acetyltransferase [unclassified Microbacterium]MDZ8172824.1 GNAT family N-acetyltransferase [Microbacterium sp. KSW-48]MDZ8202338.1 GNAT family N-acetyltransferase [Microbacterium sp. SSW1-59]
MHDFHHAPLRDVDAPTLYRLLWLRVSVFVVEQAAAYPELDGRDLEPTTELFWVTAPDDEVLATLRLLDDGDAMRIGRVATSPSARGAGVAAELMRRAIALSTRRQPNHAIRLDAQTHVAPWYARFGFAVAGPAFEEDGIPHVPMTREPLAVTGPADA